MKTSGKLKTNEWNKRHLSYKEITVIINNISVVVIVLVVYCNTIQLYSIQNCMAKRIKTTNVLYRKKIYKNEQKQCFKNKIFYACVVVVAVIFLTLFWW